jgi:hypothetical protein
MVTPVPLSPTITAGNQIAVGRVEVEVAGTVGVRRRLERLEREVVGTILVRIGNQGVVSVHIVLSRTA